MTRAKCMPHLVRSFLTAGIDGVDLVIAGDGPERAEVERLVGGEARIRLLGPIDDAEADRLLLGATVCAFPGAVGLAVNQAMAAGCPVLCADEPGPDSELVSHGVNGLRVAPSDEAAWADAMRCLICDAQMRRRLGAAARQTVASRATIPRMVDGLVQAALAARASRRVSSR